MNDPEIIEIDTPSEVAPVATDASLASRATVRDLVAIFRATEIEARAAFGAIVRAEARINAAFTLGEDRHHISINPSSERHHGVNFADPDRAIARMSREAWAVIADRLEIRRVLSAKRAKELDERLEKGELPAITEEAVFAFAREYQDVRGFFEEKVLEVFDWLRPREGSWRMDYKTNQKNARMELGPRIVLSGLVHQSWSWPNKRGGRFEVDYDDEKWLISMESIFRALDGKGWGTSGARSDLSNAIQSTPDGHGETELFEFRAYKNRSLHLRFKRLDLLARFNAIAGGKNLRPAGDRAA